jgi:hypothetical protein
MKQSIIVIQVFRLQREARFEVDAPSMEEALDLIDTGEIDLPPYDDPLWTESRSLENEQTIPV